MIEQDFELLGTTAIEDKLQEQVGETLEHLKAADLKLWVLTGDKVETAINIGYSSKLIDDEMELFIVDNALAHARTTEVAGNGTARSSSQRPGLPAIPRGH